MCTAISFLNGDHYFGRNLDLEYSYDESVTVTPRNYPFFFGDGEELRSHYAMIGTAYVVGGYPLYYDATNEKGLSVAALSFPKEAHYFDKKEGCLNVSPSELIPFLLCQCETVRDAREMLMKINLWNRPFSDDLPLTDLHFLIADKTGSLTVEPTKEGIQLYENPVGVLTNSPPFEFHLHYLSHFRALSAKPQEENFSKKALSEPYSGGMGAMGLPGDASSASRFVRAAFLKENSVAGRSETENVHQFFHILGAVEQQRGAVLLENGKYEITVYSSCCNTDKCIYYYTAYENREITGVDMYKCDPDGERLITFPLVKKERLCIVNGLG